MPLNVFRLASRPARVTRLALVAKTNSTVAPTVVLVPLTKLTHPPEAKTAFFSRCQLSYDADAKRFLRDTLAIPR